MKKLLIVAAVILVVFLGSMVWQNMNKPAQQTQQEPAAQTTSGNTSILDRIEADIASLNSQVTTLKTNDTVLRAQLDQVMNMLEKIQADVAAIKAR